MSVLLLRLTLWAADRVDAAHVRYWRWKDGHA